jgi:hypothetical protein
MVVVGVDSRSIERRIRDELIAAEPQLAPLDVPADAMPMAMEAHQVRVAQPLAITGIVENGLVRPLDPNVKLPERSRVIIVASRRS